MFQNFGIIQNINPDNKTAILLDFRGSDNSTVIVIDSYDERFFSVQKFSTHDNLFMFILSLILLFVACPPKLTSFDATFSNQNLIALNFELTPSCREHLNGIANSECVKRVIR